MTDRELFFAIARGEPTDRLYFCPDITDWYLGNHRGPGEPLKYGPGVFIPEEDSIRHEHQEHLDPEFRDLSLLDFHRRYGWGIHCHIRDWYRVDYAPGTRLDTTVEGDRMTQVWSGPAGSLTRHWQLAADGSWASLDYWMDGPEDLPVLESLVDAERYTLLDENIRRVLDGIGEMGQADIVVNRSPFGKLLHEYLGFAQTVFLLEDEPELCEHFLEVQTRKDKELMELAAASSCSLVLICDHADSTLFSPTMYRQWCIPFYKQAGEILGRANKFVSTHLDGNLHTLLPLMAQTGFHILDGCTPAPMFDYEPEELAASLAPKQTAFVGVPSALFCDGTGEEELFALADRILRAFHGRVILNVGDILPANGDIRKVIALGEYVKRHPLNGRTAGR